MTVAEAFYLPCSSVNTPHISRSNTIQQVIKSLLHKFTVADNPAKHTQLRPQRAADRGSHVGRFLHSRASQLPAHPGQGGTGPGPGDTTCYNIYREKLEEALRGTNSHN
ncbi:ras association domain-containing protein 3 isoform X1 [Tachysurus ichikawai]